MQNKDVYLKPHLEYCFKEYTAGNGGLDRMLQKADATRELAYGTRSLETYRIVICAVWSSYEI